MAQISVIVPVYRVEQYLARCVDSILSQSFSDFDLILVDDGSPDQSGAICDRYAARDSRIQVIHQKNGGLSAARNAGIDWAMEHSDSAYLAFIDSDDWVHRMYLSALYSAVQEQACKISACGAFSSFGEPIPEPGQLSIQSYSADEYYCTDRHGTDAVTAPDKLYAKDLFQNVRFPVGKLHEDEFTTYRLIYASGRVAVVNADLSAYFQNSEGIMRAEWSVRRLDALEAFEQQIKFGIKQGSDRLVQEAAIKCLYGAYDQLPQAQRRYRGLLRQKLRRMLKLGREAGFFPANQNNMWAYEAAYPCKPVWYLISRLGKEGSHG